MSEPPIVDLTADGRLVPVRKGKGRSNADGSANKATPKGYYGGPRGPRLPPDMILLAMSKDLAAESKELRGLTRVVAGVILWDTESRGRLLPPTVAKKGHHPLVRILIEQAAHYGALRDQMVTLKQTIAQLPQDNSPDYAKAIASLSNALATTTTGASAALVNLRETIVKIQAGAVAAMGKSQTVAIQFQALITQYQMFQQKQGRDLEDATDAELERLTGSAKPAEFVPS